MTGAGDDAAAARGQRGAAPPPLRAALGLCFLAACAGPARSEAEPAPARSETGATNGAERVPGGDAEASHAGDHADGDVLLSPLPECDAYLRLYRRCEPALRASIAAGDRRDFEHERGWLAYLATTPEIEGMPAACRDETRGLQALCP